jgi:hypothetical protein
MKKKTTSTDARPAAIHLTEAIYPTAVGIVKEFARAEQRSLAQAAAMLIVDGWATRRCVDEASAVMAAPAGRRRPPG